MTASSSLNIPVLVGYIYLWTEFSRHSLGLRTHPYIGLFTNVEASEANPKKDVEQNNVLFDGHDDSAEDFHGFQMAIYID